MNVVHIIGNGFDLNQGLPTSYAHFYEYYFQLRPAGSDTEPVKKLRKLLYERVFDRRTDRWADLEKTLGELTSEFESAEEFEEAYLDIYRHLLEYLKAVYDNSDVMRFEKPEETLYSDIAMPWRHLVPSQQALLERSLPTNEDVHAFIISFNYTDTLGRLCDLPNNVGKSMGRYNNRNTIYEGCQHVHHKLTTNDIIMGVDNPNQIRNEGFRSNETVLNYLLKPQTNAGMGNMVDSRCANLIRSARIICIYGMSIGETDKTWWKEIGERLMQDGSVRVLYFPYDNDIADMLPIQLPSHRSKYISQLCKNLGVKRNDVKERVLVNFCNLNRQRNIFSNLKSKSLKDNFENTMALLQEKGVIYTPEPKQSGSHLRLTLSFPIDKKQIFEPRVYKKIMPEFMKESEESGFLARI